VQVTFTKAAGRRYFMAVIRDRGVALAPRQGPGYHDHLPHDAVHFIVESEAGLTRGVFGRIADGESNIFTAADPRTQRRVARREARRPRSETDSREMARSEALASVCLPLWERRAGLRAELPKWLPPEAPTPADSELVRRILARLDDFAARWHALPVGGGVTLTWVFHSAAANRPQKHRRAPHRAAPSGRTPGTPRADSRTGRPTAAPAR